MQYLFKLIRSLPTPLRKTLQFGFALLTRAMTLGVRIIVRNRNGDILLVEHTYVGGWHLPGGGVERKETFAQAAQRELLQETGVVPVEKLRHLHTFGNFEVSRFDHVALFICPDWEWANEKERPTDYEIAQAEFFPTTDLPSNIDRRTHNHVRTYLENGEFSDIW